MQHLVGDRIALSGRLAIGQQDARDRPILRIHADNRSYSSRPFRRFAIARDLGGEGCGQIGIDWDTQLVLVDEAGLFGPATPRVEREANLNIRPPKNVGDDLVATAHEEIPECFVGSLKIERRVAAGDRAEAATLAQQEPLEVQFGNVAIRTTAAKR